MPQGSMAGLGPGRPAMLAAQNRPGRVPKISVRPPPVRIWQAIKVTKWSTNSGEFQRERSADPSPPAVKPEPSAPDRPLPIRRRAGEPVTAAAEVEAAKLAPEQEATSPKPMHRRRPQGGRRQAWKRRRSRRQRLEAAPKIDAVKPEAPRFPGNVTIMSPGDRVGRCQGRAGGRNRPASAGSGRWPPWWRWRRWRVRWVARWQPRASES